MPSTSNTRSKTPSKKPAKKGAKPAKPAKQQAVKKSDLDLTTMKDLILGKVDAVNNTLNEAKDSVNDTKQALDEFIEDFDTKAAAAVIDYFGEVNQKLNALAEQVSEQSKLNEQNAEMLARLERKFDALMTAYDIKYEEPEPAPATPGNNDIGGQNSDEHRDADDGSIGH